MNRSIKGLVVFDMDGTLIEEEVIDLLGIKAGVGEEMALWTRRAMQGEIPFKEALLHRVSLLKGQPLSIFSSVRQELHFRSGVRVLLDSLKKQGYELAVISGGFHEVIDPLLHSIGIERVSAHHLEKANGVLTGTIKGELVTKERKAAMLCSWAEELGLSLSQTIAVGDGANDREMIACAGLGVAMCPKPILREVADLVIETPDFHLLLPALERIDDHKKRTE